MKGELLRNAGKQDWFRNSLLSYKNFRAFLLS